MSLALRKEFTQPYTVVIGLGETGLSVADFLFNRGIEFKVLDTRTNPPQLGVLEARYPDVEVILGELDPDVLTRAQQIIVSPGIDIHQDAIHQAIEQNACECIGDIELFARNTSKPVIAITGSNGKSTVTTLVTAMANASDVKAYAGANLGPPALQLLEHEDAELFVLELSSFQLESVYSLQPRVSVVLNISADHLDRHGDIERYAQIKAHIYTNASVSVINRDDEYVANMQTSGEMLAFGLGQPKENEFGVSIINEEAFLAFQKEPLLPISKLSLSGESGILNSLAALSIGHAFGLPMSTMLGVLQNFKGLPHRLARVAEVNQVIWYNDSKGTNIGATVSSLRSLNSSIILIAGGVFKGGDLALFNQVVKKHVKHVILLGQHADLLQQALDQSVDIHRVESMQHAVELANKIATSGDQVLLSPACASFDMYANYIARGEDFENCVRRLML